MRCLDKIVERARKAEGVLEGKGRCGAGVAVKKGKG